MFEILKDIFFLKNRISSIERYNYRLLKHSKNPSCIITTFPRSGNTWLRYLISDCLLQLSGIFSESCDLKVKITETIPDLHLLKISQTGFSEIINAPRFLKSHHSNKLIVSYCNRSDLRFINMVRRPVDSLVSYYHYQLRMSEDSGLMHKSIDQFCLENVGNWISHLKGAIETSGKFQTLFLKFENLLENPESQIQKVFQWLEIIIDKKYIHNAIEHMSFINLQNMERNSNSSRKIPFFRSGKLGSGANELREDTVKIIDSRTSEIIADFHHLYSKQIHSLHQKNL